MKLQMALDLDDMQKALQMASSTRDFVDIIEIGTPLIVRFGVDAVKMMTATPARIIGVNDRKGRIEIGLDADLVLFDKEIDIKMTIVNGRIVYNSI